MIMEREVGEVFDFKGVMLQVIDTGKRITCDGCYFDKSKYECPDAHIQDCIGFCLDECRSDGKNVVFVEVEDDQIRRISNE